MDRADRPVADSRFSKRSRFLFFQCSHSEEDEVWYFSSKPQFDELMDSLDRHVWEADLVEALEEHREVIEKQMSTTEMLSREKGGAKKSYLECQNGKSIRGRASRQALSCGVEGGYGG